MPEGSYDQFIVYLDINHIACEIKNDTTCLHDEDAISIKLWADRLRSDNTLVFLKDMLDPSPLDSRLQQDSVVMCIQTKFQVEMFQQLGNQFIGIDATHNVTNYHNYLFFTLIAQDHWGHGM
jgi:hypothetical protein